jgi:hypothetical protein
MGTETGTELHTHTQSYYLTYNHTLIYIAAAPLDPPSISFSLFFIIPPLPPSPSLLPPPPSYSLLLNRLHNNKRTSPHTPYPAANQALKLGDTYHDASYTAAGVLTSPVDKRYPRKVIRQDEFFFTFFGNRVLRVVTEVCMSWTAHEFLRSHGFAPSAETGEEGFYGIGRSPLEAARALSGVRETLCSTACFRALIDDSGEHGSRTGGVWTVKGVGV